MNGTEVATPPPPAFGYYKRSPQRRKPVQKRTPYFYILESESSQESDDGSETSYSIQGKETDVAKDTSDTDWSDEDIGSVIEYDVVSPDEKEDEQITSQVLGDISSSDNDIDFVGIAMLSSGDIMSADSEDSSSTDGETSQIDYVKCAQCGNDNNNRLYRYCKRCYKSRKDLFPPRPRRKLRPKIKGTNYSRSAEISKKKVDTAIDSINGICSAPALNFKSIVVPPSLKNETAIGNNDILPSKSTDPFVNTSPISISTNLKTDENLNGRKRTISGEQLFISKKLKTDVCENDVTAFSQPLFPTHDLAPITKTKSHPCFSKDDMDKVSLDPEHYSDVESNVSNGSKNSDREMCMICLSKPKTGVFVHGRIAHICCCYECSVKVWFKTRRCPMCHSRVSNVVKAFYSD